MAVKKLPVRMCIVCKGEFVKKDLDRIVKTDNGIVLDKTGKLGGRGAYICHSDECKNNLFKNKVLNKAFKQNISAEVYENLKEQFFGK